MRKDRSELVHGGQFESHSPGVGGSSGEGSTPWPNQPMATLPVTRNRWTWLLLLCCVLAAVSCSGGDVAPDQGSTLEEPWRDVTVVLGAPIRGTPGNLPQAAASTLAGINLGEGLVPEPQYGDPGAPSLWMSDAPLDGSMWADLVAAFPDTGLWPLVLDSLEPQRPWRGGEFGAAPEEPAPTDRDALSVLRSWSAGGVTALAAGSEAAESTALRIPPGESFSPALGLVAVERPADAVYALSWGGAANYDHDHADSVAVLRSWEDRFGAYVVRLGFATMSLWVDRPPTNLDDARLLASEIFAWCPTLAEMGVDPEEVAMQLIDDNIWSCWWD